MADRPIIFSAPMIRALLAGRKTQTRRVLKRTGYDLASCPRATLCDGGLIQFEHPRGGPFTCVRAPYMPGDRLWVREAWRTIEAHDAYNAREIAERCSAAGYKSTWAPIEHLADEVSSGRFDWPKGAQAGRYRHARFMPRWASRITLDVTAVRVQRLQEISREDAIAEGCESPLIGSEAPRPGPGVYLADERTSFAQLWNRLHGLGAWGANPWVIALSFNAQEGNIDA